MPDTIRVGIAGLGNFAQAQHIPNLARMAGVQLVSFCDTDRSKLKALGPKYNVTELHESFESMLDQENIDALVLTVRDVIQAEMAMQALDRGLDVYVEKPLSHDPEVCRRVIECSEHARGRLAVGYNKRFAPMYVKAKEILSRYGSPSMIHLAMTDDAWRWARGYEPGYLLVLDVCHHFDLIQWLTESPITSVTCRSTRSENDALLLTTASGCVATIMFSGHDSMDAPKEYARIIGDKFSLTGEDFVELFVHGIQEEPQSYRFKSHIQNGSPFLQRRLTKRQGIAGWRDIRRIAWELYTESARGEAASSAHEQPFIPNFLRDQGWFASLYGFLTTSNHHMTHANAIDAMRIAQVTAAAVKSRLLATTEEVVRDA